MAGSGGLEECGSTMQGWEGASLGGLETRAQRQCWLDDVRGRRGCVLGHAQEGVGLMTQGWRGVGSGRFKMPGSNGVW